SKHGDRSHERAATLAAMDDRELVAQQLGRAPRAFRRVVARCPFGLPSVTEQDPYTATGEPFPTTYYLTCRHLVAEIARLEAAGGSSASWARHRGPRPAARRRPASTIRPRWSAMWRACGASGERGTTASSRRRATRRTQNGSTRRSRPSRLSSAAASAPCSSW